MIHAGINIIVVEAMLNEVESVLIFDNKTTIWISFGGRIESLVGMNFGLLKILYMHKFKIHRNIYATALIHFTTGTRFVIYVSNMQNVLLIILRHFLFLMNRGRMKWNVSKSGV